MGAIATVETQAKPPARCQPSAVWYIGRIVCGSGEIRQAFHCCSAHARSWIDKQLRELQDPDAVGLVIEERDIVTDVIRWNP